jgi:hypothetical protein
MNLSPGADLKKLQQAKAGETVTLAPGTYKGGASISGLHNVTINAGGAIISGGPNGLKFTDCQGVTLTGCEVLAPKNYGLFFANCKSTTLTRVQITNAGITGILTTHVDDFSALDCIVTGSIEQWAIYISERASKVRIVGGELSRCGRGAVQVNCDKGGGTDIEVRNIVAIHNQDHPSNHAAAIQFAYVNGGRILNNQIQDHAGRWGVSVIWKSQAVTVDGNKFGFAKGYGDCCVFVGKGAKANAGPLNVAAAGVPLCVRE